MRISEVQTDSGPGVLIQHHGKKIERSSAEVASFCAYCVAHFPQLIIPVKLKHLQALLAHPVIQESSGYREFVESEFQFNPDGSPRLRRARSKGGGFSISSLLSAPVEDTDMYFQHAHSVTIKYETGLAALAKQVDKISKEERATHGAYLDVASRYHGLAKISTNVPILERILRKTTKAFKIAGTIHFNNSIYLSTTFSEMFTQHSKASTNALVALNHRRDALSDHDVACRNTAKKVASLEKLKNYRNINPDKVDVATRELVETKKVESETREAFIRIDETVKEEYDAFNTAREQDLIEDLDAYVKKNLEFHTQLLQLWSLLDSEIQMF